MEHRGYHQEENLEFFEKYLPLQKIIYHSLYHEGKWNQRESISKEHWNTLLFSRGGSHKEEEEIAVDTHGLTSYHILSKIKIQVEDHYTNNEFERVLKEVEPLLQGVDKIEEEKHEIFREIMSKVMYACLVRNEKEHFQKACSQYSKAIGEITTENQQ